MYSCKSINCGLLRCSSRKVNQIGVMDSPYGIHLVHKVFPSRVKIVEAFHGHDFLEWMGFLLTSLKARPPITFLTSRLCLCILGT
jgi:hypothetical protein